jgi:hypothetical protein
VDEQGGVEEEGEENRVEEGNRGGGRQRERSRGGRREWKKKRRGEGEKR